MLVSIYWVNRLNSVPYAIFSHVNVQFGRAIQIASFIGLLLQVSKFWSTISVSPCDPGVVVVHSCHFFLRDVFQSRL